MVVVPSMLVLSRGRVVVGALVVVLVVLLVLVGVASPAAAAPSIDQMHQMEALFHDGDRFAQLVDDLQVELARRDDADDTQLVETGSQLQAGVNLVAGLSNEDFQAMLNSRNPVWLEMQQQLESEAAADASSDAEDAELLEADSDSDADADVDAELDAEADVDAESDAESDSAAQHFEFLEANLPAVGGACGSGGVCRDVKNCPTASNTQVSGKCAGSNSIKCCVPKAKSTAPKTTGNSKVTQTLATGANALGQAAKGAGKAAGASGTRGGASGTRGGASGTRGGASGTRGGASGTRGGASGTRGGTGHAPVVQPKKQVTSWIPRMQPNVAYTEKRAQLCFHFYRMFLFRYGFGKDKAVADKRIREYNGNPLKFCTEKATGTARRATQVAFEEVEKYPGRAFVNPVIQKWNASIESQLQCGSCWAQAAVGSFEVALRKAGRFVGDLSVQQLLDCVRGPSYPESDGCNGGTPMEALKYLQNNGAALARDYPYTARTGTCQTGKATGPRSGGWTLVHLPAQTVKDTGRDYSVCRDPNCQNQWRFEVDLILSIKTSGPFIAYVDASRWQSYRAGVMPTSYCSSTLEAGNHIVELLGYGQENGIPYWLVKNSWGTGWGEGGFIKLPIGHNACGLINWIGKSLPPRPGTTPTPPPTPKTTSSAPKQQTAPKNTKAPNNAKKFF